MLLEYACNTHILEADEAPDHPGPETLMYWERVDLDNEALGNCSAPGCDAGATWTCWSREQIRFIYEDPAEGKAIIESLGLALQPDRKLDELLLLLRTLQLQPRPPVLVSLKKSSSKDGGEGYDLDIAHSATPEDVDRAIDIALAGRRKLLDTLYAPLDLKDWPSTRDEG